MRAVNLGLGEVADRLTILALKIAHAADEGKEAAHFVNERNALLVMLRGMSYDAGVEHLFTLAAVNGMLWGAEDEMREWREQTPEGADRLELLALRDVAACAFRIQALNDQRAELVRVLNKAAGTDYGQEKL